LKRNFIIRTDSSYDGIGDVLIQERFNISEQLNSTLSNITFGQLLDINPKVRSELSKLSKLEKKSIASATSNLNPSITFVNNISYNYKSHSKETTEDELIMEAATFEDQSVRLFLNTYSNINIITRGFLHWLRRGSFSCKGRD